MTKKKQHKKFNIKQHKEGDPFPEDFWNYNINPITGYYVGLLKDIRGVINSPKKTKDKKTVENTA
jgi:hypothetical protein